VVLWDKAGEKKRLPTDKIAVAVGDSNHLIIPVLVTTSTKPTKPGQIGIIGKTVNCGLV
jgi:hypothetical protein